jgi:hypothetical protein
MDARFRGVQTDKEGGFYFTDLGKRHPRHRDNGGVYYALPDGSKRGDAMNSDQNGPRIKLPRSLRCTRSF